MKDAWQQDTSHLDPYQILFHKLKMTGIHLSKWSKSLFSKAKIQLHAALMIILRLDVAQESRTLACDKLELRSRLKRRAISLSVLQCSQKKQYSWITNLKDSDANTKFSHLRLNARKRKNQILCLKHNNSWVTGHEKKRRLSLSISPTLWARVIGEKMTSTGTTSTSLIWICMSLEPPSPRKR